MLFLVYGRYGNAFPVYTRCSDLAVYFSSVRTLYLFSSILFPVFGLNKDFSVYGRYNAFPVYGLYNAFPVYGRNSDFQVYGRNNIFQYTNVTLICQY